MALIIVIKKNKSRALKISKKDKKEVFNELLKNMSLN